MSIPVLLWLIATILFVVSIFVSPARFNIGMAGLAFLAAGFVAQGLGTAG